MNYLISTVVAILAAGLAYLSLDATIANRIKLFAVALPEETYHTKTFSKRRRGVVSAVLAVIVFFAALRALGYVSHPIGRAKMLLALLCMVGAGCFDFREQRIPNIFPAVLALGAVILLGLGVLTGQNGAMSYVTTNVLAAVACAVVLLGASLLTKHGIGAGDIKLIAALALMTGVSALIGTLFYGVIACALFAAIALILKKKTKSSSVPFGPFLLLGYIIMLFTTNY